MKKKLSVKLKYFKDISIKHKAQLSNITRECFYSEEKNRDFSDSMFRANDIIFYKVINSNLVAYMLLDFSGKKIYVYNVCTGINYRKMGLMVNLFNELINFAKASFFSELNLECYKDNIGALNLYRSLGFLITDSYDEPGKFKQRVLVMKKKI